MEHKYKIGQKVYYMKDNKIAEGTIGTRNTLEYLVSVGGRITCNHSYALFDALHTPSNDYMPETVFYASKEELIADLTKNLA
jgi:hypothetical protein